MIFATIFYGTIMIFGLTGAIVGNHFLEKHLQDIETKLDQLLKEHLEP